ncbi:hypothetical protein ANANG_G00291440, partial [Anguilla anguilla]
PLIFCSNSLIFLSFSSSSILCLASSSRTFSSCASKYISREKQLSVALFISSIASRSFGTIGLFTMSWLLKTQNLLLQIFRSSRVSVFCCRKSRTG